MLRQITILLFLVTSIWSQSSLDILNAPNNAQAAALGITNNPIIKPTRILTHPARQLDLSVWNWVADIQGGIIGLELDNSYFGFRTMQIGNIEYRGDIPTEDPLSTFGYALFNTGASYSQAIGSVIVGAGVEYLYERTLNASANGLSLNMAAAFNYSESILFSAGISHLGTSQELEEERTSFPTELWLEMEWKLPKIKLQTEFTSGEVPLTMAATYPVLDLLEILSSVQIASAGEDISILPSAGFVANWDNFKLGYSLYQLTHTLGPRHFISIYWNY